MFINALLNPVSCVIPIPMLCKNIGFLFMTLGLLWKNAGILETKYGIRNLSELFVDPSKCPSKLRVSHMWSQYVHHQHQSMIFGGDESTGRENLFFDTTASGRYQLFVGYQSLREHFSPDELQLFKQKADAAQTIADRVGRLIKARNMYRVYDTEMQTMFMSNNQFRHFFPQNVSHREVMFLEMYHFSLDVKKFVEKKHYKFPRDVFLREQEMIHLISECMKAANNSCSSTSSLRKRKADVCGELENGAGGAEGGEESGKAGGEEGCEHHVAKKHAPIINLLDDGDEDSGKHMSKKNVKLGTESNKYVDRLLETSPHLRKGKYSQDALASLVSRTFPRLGGSSSINNVSFQSALDPVATDKFNQAQSALIKQLMALNSGKGPVMNGKKKCPRFQPAWDKSCSAMKLELVTVMRAASGKDRQTND